MVGRATPTSTPRSPNRLGDTVSPAVVDSQCLPGGLEDNARPSQGAVTKLASPLPLQQAVIVLPGWQLWVGGTALNTIRGPWDMCHTWPPPPPPWVLWSDVMPRGVSVSHLGPPLQSTSPWVA